MASFCSKTLPFHEKEVKENERLKIAIEEADSENRAKTEFMNRMSHDIRTPINGIMGMLDIIHKNRQDETRVDEQSRQDPAFNKTSSGTGK